MKSEDSDVEKVDSAIHGEMIEQLKMEEEMISSVDAVKENHEQPLMILGNREEEECKKDSNLVNNTITSDPIMLTCEESNSSLGDQEEEELMRESDAVIEHEEEKSQHVMEEMKSVEIANDDIVCEEDVKKEEVENEVEVISKKKKGKLIKKGKRLLNKKKVVLKGIKEGCQEEEELMRESNAMITHEEEKSKHVMEEMNSVEIANDDVLQEEDAKQGGVKNEGQAEVISMKKKGKLIKKGKSVLNKNKVVLNGIKEVIVKDTNDQKLLNKENCRTMEELNNKVNGAGEVLRENEAKQEVQNVKQIKEISKKKTGKLGKKAKRGFKKKLALKGVNEVIKKGTDDQEASNKKAPKKAKVAGMIFMCSSKTKQDCYHYKVLGLPSSKRDVVLEIYEGMKLFLFDFDLKLLYGIYRAAGPGGYNIEPKAFKSAFPSQVRFNVYEDCLPLPEEKFKKVIKDNYYNKNKFDCQLAAEQVKNLCKLFQAASKGSNAKGLRRDLGAQTNKPPRRESHRARSDDSSLTFRGQERNRKRPHRAENHTFEDRNRNRKRYRDAYGREVYASSVVPAPFRPPLSPPQSSLALTFPPRSYAYEGTHEMNPYRRDVPAEHQDRFRGLELTHREQIELQRDSFHEHRDGWFRDLELRHRREIDHYDPYVYRDRHLYHDLTYSPAEPTDYHLHHPRRLLHHASPHDSGPYDRRISSRSRY